MTYYSTPPRSDELYHYGIKGMRWGVRKYQNEDGSLTAAGERRYQNADRAYHDVAKAIYKREKKLRKLMKKQGRLYDDEYFGENAKKAQKGRDSYYESDAVKRRMKLEDRIEELKSIEEGLWEMDRPQQEKDSIRRKIESLERQHSKIKIPKNTKSTYSKSAMTKAKLMDLGFNERTADALEKKTGKSKRAFRRYYL